MWSIHVDVGFQVAESHPAMVSEANLLCKDMIGPLLALLYQPYFPVPRCSPSTILVVQLLGGKGKRVESCGYSKMGQLHSLQMRWSMSGDGSSQTHGFSLL